MSTIVYSPTVVTVVPPKAEVTAPARNTTVSSSSPVVTAGAASVVRSMALALAPLVGGAMMFL